ncbi:DUF6318 family protein [Brachybacterium sp.]|uniref:DUF6318 family protein n=1 Tax=Brachybacterium sp. TaxID=1891286 RepID=UPI002ED2331C
MASPRLCALSVTALLVLGLSACDSTPEPVKTPPPSIGISAPSDGGGDSGGGGERDGGGEETASGPEDIPAPDPADFAGMDEETPEGAEQAYRYYWAVLVWAHQTGDSERVESLSSQDCGACSSYADEIKQLAEDDGLWIGSAHRDEDISHIAGTKELEEEGYDVAVIYEFSLSEHSIKDPQTGDRVSEPEANYRTTGGLVWSGEGWVVAGLAIEWVRGSST